MNILKYQFLLNFVIIGNYFSYEDFFLMAKPMSDCSQIQYLLIYFIVYDFKMIALQFFLVHPKLCC